MSAILSITFPIYAVIAIGYITVRAGWFKQEHLPGFGRYVMDVAMPALLFNAVAGRDIGEVLIPSYMLAYLLGSLATIAIAWVWFSVVAPDASRRAIAIMGSTCPNSGFVGFPTMLLLFPEQAGVILGLNMLVENVVLIPICLILLDLAQGGRSAAPVRQFMRILLGVLKRPMVIGLLLGLLASFVGVSIPAPLERLFGMLAASAAALSLFVIGGALVGLPMKGNLRLASHISAAKLLLHPALVALAVMGVLALGIGEFSAEMQVAVILSAAMPMFGIYTVFAQQHGLEGVASIAMLIATSAAFVTLTVLLLYLV